MLERDRLLHFTARALRHGFRHAAKIQAASPEPQRIVSESAGGRYNPALHMDAIDRRSFLTVCSSVGLSSTIFADTLWGLAQAPAQTPEPKPEQTPLPP